MPPLETAGLTQTATLWEPYSPSKRGEKRVREPVEIPVRWTVREGIGVGTGTVGGGAEGGTNPIDAEAVVDVDVPIGSLMWLGEHVEWNPEVSQELMEVVGMVITPDVKGRNIRRTLTMRRYRNSLPDVVPQQVEGSGSGG